jgi:hypothetical protein
MPLALLWSVVGLAASPGCSEDGPQAVDDAIATLFETYRAVDDGPRDAGRRRDTDVRVGLGVALWQ